MIESNILFPFRSTWLDYPDNESLSLIIYFLGCDFGCLECHNKHLKDSEYNHGSRKMNLDFFNSELNKYSNSNKTDKLVFSGGDPLSKYNIEFVKEFLKQNDKYKICIYTGNLIEYVKENNVIGFEYIKCGTYSSKLSIKPEKTNEYLQFSSKNQRLYDKNYNLISDSGRFNFK